MTFVLLFFCTISLIAFSAVQTQRAFERTRAPPYAGNSSFRD